MSQATSHINTGPQESSSRELGYTIAARTAAVAAVFSLIVCALMLFDLVRGQVDDPHEAPEMKALKAALALQPDNEALKEQVRALDVELGTKYFLQRRFRAIGAILLLGGVIVFLVAAKTASTLRRKLPMPGPQAGPVDRETGMAGAARWAVASISLLLAAAAVGLIVNLQTILPRNEQALADLTKPGGGAQPGDSDENPVPAEPGYPSDDEIAKNWPSFRGPGGSGVSAYTNVPDAWDEASGKNIRFKTQVPLPGVNSPVVWNDRVFLSGANEEKREVYCFSTTDGKLLWQKEVPTSPQTAATEPPEPDQATGFAAPTTATDGRRVYAIFANGDLAAFDFEGNLVWNKSLGVPENSYGHASSLVTYKNLLLVQFDQARPKDEKSQLIAFDGATGNKVWVARRKVPSSWSSPIVIHAADRDQVIVCADPAVTAYNPADGSEIWRADVLSGEHGPTPVFANGLIQAGNEYCQWSAIKPDGTGDVTETHVAWTAEDGLPDTCSPLATEDFVLLMPSSAYFTCIDAKSGEFLWDHEFEYAIFTSSPSLVGKRIYLFGELESEDEEDEEGYPLRFCRCWVVEVTRDGCEVIGQSDLREGCVTSPAFQDGCFYIRGKKHLYCIGEPLAQ